MRITEVIVNTKLNLPFLDSPPHFSTKMTESNERLSS